MNEHRACVWALDHMREKLELLKDIDLLSPNGRVILNKIWHFNLPAH